MFGGFVRSYSGFGFALAAVPVLCLVMPPVGAIPAVLPVELAIGLLTLPGERSRVAWTALTWLVLGTLVGTPIGVALLSRIPAEQMRIAISLVVILAVVILWRRPRLPLDMLGRPALAVAGLTSGLFNGGTAMGAPPAIIAILGSPLDPRDARATLVAFVAFSAALGTALGIATGLLNEASLGTTLAMAPGAALGGFLGIRIFARTAPESYRGHSLAILLIVSISASGSAAFVLMRSLYY
ncbi:hypothetical protein ASF32_22775 [Methylobacterium sp. Leaf91]|nr:sulfite exporter TauE/SafE family protein [Methylobacterium sp. Leaf91]KQO91157.1 hypothetical protein ASF32_22775 [Methylobacterium sp. Leaf91]